eukprot:302987_1
MAQIAQEDDQESITTEANTLLTKLNKSYVLLQKLNEEIESRPFATRIHGQFDHELKKSQSTISKLSSLLRKYYSFDFSSTLSSLEIKADDELIPKPIDTAFVIDFKDICLKIEREWRIGTKLIIDFDSKYGRNDSEHYYSDSDTRYGRIKYNQKLNKRRRSQSPITASFSNPSSPLFGSSKAPSVNLSQSQSQLIQKQTLLTHKASDDASYHAKIGSDFVPFDEEQKLNQQIRDINGDLQYLLEINKQVNELVIDQGKNVENMHQNVSDIRENVQQATDTLASIHKSPVTYGVIGGITAAALGAPMVLVGLGIKAAFESAIGFGTLGALTGTIYAKKVNDQMDEENRRDKEQRLLDDAAHDEVGTTNVNRSNKGFQTKPRKRVTMDKLRLNDDDDDDDIDVWDARN